VDGPAGLVAVAHNFPAPDAQRWGFSGGITLHRAFDERGGSLALLEYGAGAAGRHNLGMGFAGSVTVLDLCFMGALPLSRGYRCFALHMRALISVRALSALPCLAGWASTTTPCTGCSQASWAH